MGAECRVLLSYVLPPLFGEAAAIALLGQLTDTMQDGKIVTIDVFLILALCAYAVRISLVFQWGQYFQKDDQVLTLAMATDFPDPGSRCLVTKTAKFSYPDISNVIQFLTFVTCVYAVNSQFDSWYWQYEAQNVSENGIFSALHASSMLANRTVALLLCKRVFPHREIGNLLQIGRTMTWLLWLPVVTIGILQAVFDHGGAGNTFMDLNYLMQIPVSALSLVLTLMLIFLPLPWILPLKVNGDEDLTYAKFGMGFLMAIGAQLPRGGGDAGRRDTAQDSSTRDPASLAGSMFNRNLHIGVYVSQTILTSSRLMAAGKIHATVSQSRFHKDAVETDNKDIHVRDLSLTIGQRELLSHTNLYLQAKRHYVLVGRNGTGKSSLLQALSDGTIPGIPSTIKILLLSQLSIDKGEREVQTDPARAQTVLEHVVKSDKHRERLLEDRKALSTAFESENPLAPVRTERALALRDLRLRLAEANEIATFRSGARGLKARKVLNEVEAQVEKVETLAAQGDEDIDAEQTATETSAAVDRMNQVEASLSLMGADSADTQAILILKGLGFKDEQIQGSFTSLSGGWRTRCLIAAALFQSSDVLLLDEPTNFLDLPAIVWLQSYIQDLHDRTVVAITHDRDFADAIAEQLIVLRDQTLTDFNGNLSTYEVERRKYAKWMQKMKDALEHNTKHMEQTIQKNVKAAKRSGDDKKLKQAASRKKKLEERTGLEVSAKGGRFKLNRDLPGYHLTNRAEIEVPQFELPVKLTIPTEPPELKLAGSLVSLENVAFSYRRGAKPILEDVNLVLQPGDRVALLGLNGAGKSTLIKLVMGPDAEDGLKPSRGAVDLNNRIRVACFSQHVVEQLEAKGTKEPALTSLKEIMDIGGDSMTEQQARGLLSGVGLSGRTASDVPVAALSGGQKARVALISLLVVPPHLLILDEVTSHLDTDTVTALAEALKAYRGALLVASHDRYFVRTVVEGEPAVRRGESSGEESDEEEEQVDVKGDVKVYQIAARKLKKLEGGMDEYEAFCERKIQKALTVAVR